jgi:hypothetical protein
MMKLSSEHQRGEATPDLGRRNWMLVERTFSLLLSTKHIISMHVAEEAPTPQGSTTIPWSEH